MSEQLLCSDCKNFNVAERALNCYIKNSFDEFCKNHKVDAIITDCAKFDKLVSIEIEEDIDARQAELEARERKEEKEEVEDNRYIEGDEEFTDGAV